MIPLTKQSVVNENHQSCPTCLTLFPGMKVACFKGSERGHGGHGGKRGSRSKCYWIILFQVVKRDEKWTKHEESKVQNNDTICYRRGQKSLVSYMHVVL